MDKNQNMYEKMKIGSYRGPIVNNNFDANLEKVKKKRKCCFAERYETAGVYFMDKTI